MDEMTITDAEKSPAQYPTHLDQRSWTAVERYKLKGLINQKVPAKKIARTLKRPLTSITAMANRLGLPID